ALGDMWSAKQNSSGFRFRPRKEVDSDSRQRAYTTAETGTWWHDAQELVGPDAVIAALIFYSDVTHLSSNGKKQAHPAMMTLGNIPFPKRWGPAGHSLLAMLPIPPKDMPNDLKVEIFNTCVAKLMEPLVQLKERGVLLKDANGVEHKVIPLLLGWAADYPESGKLTCTLSGQRCMKPCSICYVDRDNLSSVNMEHIVRTPEQQQWVLSQAEGETSDDDSTLSKYSTFDVECALWQWAINGHPWANPCLAVMPDIMHMADLGILDHIIKCIRKAVPRAVKKLDKRLKIVQEATRINSMRFPEKEYFESNATVPAFQHRAVMQVLIFLVADILDAPQLEAIRAYLDWYSCCNSHIHTEASLRELQRKAGRLVKLLVKAFPDQKSEWNLIKTHLMTHFVPVIRRAGYVQEYSTNLFEHLHSVLLKQIYRRTNKRDADKQIMKRHEQRLDLWEDEESDHGRETAMATAIEEGIRVMTKESHFFPVEPTGATESTNDFVKGWSEQHPEAHAAFKGALTRASLTPSKVR
ncbi:unnamed protein product, partial [Closterium sp. Naga37s-1]